MELTSLQRRVQSNEIPLERLAANSAIPEKEKVHEVSRQFEAVLLRQILSKAQQPHFKSKYADSSAPGEIYRDLVTQQLADGISKSGSIGLAGVLDEQFQRRAPSHSPSNSDPVPPPPKLHPRESRGAYHPGQ